MKLLSIRNALSARRKCRNPNNSQDAICAMDAGRIGFQTIERGIHSIENQSILSKNFEMIWTTRNFILNRLLRRKRNEYPGN